MKLILLLLSMLFFNSVFSQDSTKIKLDQYKSWKDAGIIDDAEYTRLKANVLHLPIETEKHEVKSKMDSASLEALRIKAGGGVGGGAVLLSLGGAFIIGTTVYAILTPPGKVSSRGIYTSNSDRPIIIGSGIGVGCVTMIIGAVVLGIGIKHKVEYKINSKKMSASLSPTPNGLVLNF